MKECSVEGCERKHNARGYCFGHYERWKKLGHPDVSRPLNTHVAKGASLAERLARRIPVGLSDNECWPWQGALGGRKPDGRGYGKFTFRGKQYDAHRVAWELHSGQEIPAGLQVMHSCDNPRCINPLHLNLGTNDDNVADMVAKQRHTYGERNASAILTEEAVRDIRAHGREDCPMLAAKYGTTVSAILQAWKGINWGYLDA